MPQYANVALAGNVVPLPWAGSTGGVLVLQSSGTVTMAGFNLDATGRGFRGGGVSFIAPFGPPIIDPVNGTSFYLAPVGSLAAGPGGEREGSFKGEGIAGTPRLVYNGVAQVDIGVDGYPGGSRGRGSPGNAGGGGNNQNAGGGGGGNGGQGGQGGGGWNDVSRPTTFRDAGGVGGDGAGRAGNNLALNAARLIMGGGGGGHVDGGGTNCQNGGWGGNGGGIVIVRAASLTGSGSLLSSGADGRAPNTAGGCTDAAGGAGAGGTLVAAVGTGLGGRALQANGGNGANSSYTQHGPGGGGGGGVSYYSTGAGAPTSIANGGINGLDATAVPAAWFSAPGAASSLNSPDTTVTPNCSTRLEVTKTDGITNTVAGGTTSYTVTFTNSGSTAANNATVSDNPGVGLICSVASCTASTTPIVAACPAPALWPNLLTGGVALPGFPPKSTVTFVIDCGVTATGQ